MSAARAPVTRTVPFGEHAAGGVGQRERERAAILELERQTSADQRCNVGEPRERDGALNAVQPRDRQSRYRHALVAADAIGNLQDLAVLPADGADTGEFFNEFQHAHIVTADFAFHCRRAFR